MSTYASSWPVTMRVMLNVADPRSKKPPCIERAVDELLEQRPPSAAPGGRATPTSRTARGDRCSATARSATTSRRRARRACPRRGREEPLTVLDLVHDAELRRRRASRRVTAAAPRPTRSTTRARRPRAGSRRSGRRAGSHGAGRSRRSRGPRSRTRCRRLRRSTASVTLLGDLVDRHRHVAAGRDADADPRARLTRATARPRARTRAARSSASRVTAGSSGPVARQSPGGYEHALVELEVALGETRHRELLGPGAARRDQPVAQRRVVEHRAAAPRAARRRRRAARAARRCRRGRRWRSPRSPTRPPACPPPCPRAARRRTTRRATTGAQNTVAPRRRESRSASVIAPSHSTFAALDVARSSSVCGPAPPTHSTASRSSRPPRVEQHRETLARLVPAR